MARSLHLVRPVNRAQPFVMPSLIETFARLLCALVLTWSALGTRPARAQDAAAPTVEIILDGSGSMWGRFDANDERRGKIDIVRELLKPIVSAEPRARIGLQSFGHRRRGDCSDLEVLVPPASERTGLLAAIDKLNPNGKGPLAESLRLAAQTIGAERPAAIIVIHDGIDNCRQDACAAAADVAKTASGVPVHLIGLAIDPAEQPAVQCIANATGGKFYDARDPLALAAALQEAATEAFGTDSSAKSAPSADAAAKTGGPSASEAAAALPQAAIRATVTLADGKPPLSGPTQWTLQKAGSDTPVTTLTGATLTQDVEPGAYVLAVERDGLTARAPITVEPGKPVTLALSLNAGQLQVKAKTPGTLTPLIAIKETSDGKTAGRTLALKRSAAVDMVLPPATYLVAMTAGEMRQEKTVTVASGEDATVTFDTGMGSLKLTSTLQDGGPTLPDALFLIQEDDPDSPGGRREVRRSRASDPTFLLPPGTYYAVARSGLAESRMRIAISAGDTLERAITLPAAPVKLATSIGSAAAPDNAGIVLRILSLDGTPTEIARVAGTTFSALLNAGRYRVIAGLDAHGAGTMQEIVVEAGKPLSKILRIEAGEVALKAAGSAPDAFWQVRDEAGKAVWHAAGRDPRVLLAPGRYSVRMEQRDRTDEASFAVSAGETKTIELGPH